MGDAMSGMLQFGEATAVVQTLRGFGTNRKVPLGLVARMVGREKSAVIETINSLNAGNDHALIKIVNDDAILAR